MNTRKHLPLCWILLLFSIHFRWLWRQLGRGKVVICTIVFKYKIYLLNPNFPSVIQRKWRCSVAGAGDVGRIDRTLLPNVYILCLSLSFIQSSKPIVALTISFILTIIWSKLFLYFERCHGSLTSGCIDQYAHWNSTYPQFTSFNT